jgi:hypothetical protein
MAVEWCRRERLLYILRYRDLNYLENVNKQCKIYPNGWFPASGLNLGPPHRRIIRIEYCVMHLLLLVKVKVTRIGHDGPEGE